MSVDQAAGSLNNAVKGEQTRHYPSRLSVLHAEDLFKRGITTETIEAAGLFTAQPEEVRTFLNLNPTNSGGIAIPYIHPLTGETRIVRVRPDKPPLIDGKPAKYLSPKGAGNLLYFPPGCAERLKNIAEPLYWTEAEFKALALWQAKLLGVSSIGVWGWRGKGLDGQSQSIPDLDPISWQGRTVTIVFDSDVAVNPEVKRARQALAKELYRRGAAVVYAVNLPALNGGKIGVDDFLAAHGLDAFLDLDAFELPPTDLPPFLEPVSNLLEGTDEPIEWGIEGLQPIGANGWRIAGPKVGKSWDMIEEAYCLATGQPVYDHFRVPQRRKVVVIEEEDPKKRLRRRLRRIIHAHGGVEPSDEFFRCSVKKGFRLDDPKWREVIEWEIRSFRPDFVYLDVFTRLHAKSINDPEAMGGIVLFLDYLIREYGCTFVILHHTRKNSAGGDDHDEIIGSRILGGFSEATLFFSKTKEKGLLRVKVSLKDEPEDGSFEPEFLIRLSDTPDQKGTSFEYLGPPPEKKVSMELREKVKAFVLEQGVWKTIKEIAEAVRCSKTTAREHLDALTDLKEIARDRRGQAYIYAPLQTPQTLNFPGGEEG